MRSAPKGLSKSRYCAGLQCLRQLWWRAHEPNAPELTPDAARAAIFEQGNRVGALARTRFPGGVLIDFEPWQFKEKIAATRDALEQGAPYIYEASFKAAGVFVAVDVLARDGGRFRLIEVKSSTKAKDEHLPDVAVQLHVLRAAGLAVERAELMHLNRECRYPELSNLFALATVTDEVKPLLAQVPGNIARMQDALAGALPDVKPGPHCDSPHECPFKSRCLPKLPRHHVSTLYRLGARAAALAAEGFETIHQLPDGLELPAVAARQVKAVKTGRVVVERGLKVALAALQAPVAYLDFETVAPAIPVWDGCAPYGPVAVQLSCHLVDSAGRVRHSEYLAEGATDPRAGVAAAVVAVCAGANTVVAWNASFEKQRLDELAGACPAHREALADIAAKLVDLLPIVRENVYHPDFDGSFSIKKVLPALVPSLSYADLDVAEGALAQALLEQLLLDESCFSAPQKTRLRAQLLAYCKRDTEGLVEVARALRELAAAQ